MHPSNNFPQQPQQQQPAGVANWFKFFQEERELYLQNTSLTQLSMQFETGPGQFVGLLIPIGPNPICLTNEVDWPTIKKSLDFRKLLNRVPAVMKLMSTEEAYKYFADYAKTLGAYIPDPATGAQVPNISAAMEHATKERLRLTTRPDGDGGTVVGPNGQVIFAPPKTAQELQGYQQPHMGISAQSAATAGLTHVPQGFQQQAAGGNYQGPTGFANAPQFEGGGAPQAFNPANAGFSNIGEAPVMTESVVSPRVVALCQQVSTQIPPNQRMQADPFFSELKLLSAGLSFEDLQYIESFGTYRTVIKWAKALIKERAAAGQGGQGIEDNLELDGPIGQL